MNSPHVPDSEGPRKGLLRVTVTADHIARGIARNCEACPVALALGELPYFAAYSGVSVNATTVVFYSRGHGFSYEYLTLPLPPEAGEFVNNFDAGAPVEPFSFDLNTDTD